MAKFILVRSPSGEFSESRTEEGSFYINVEMIRYVAQNAQNPDRSSIRFTGDEHALQISESAANFVSRVAASS
jgi:hypothetical protein